MDGNKNITASFAINTYTITATTDGNGTINPPGVSSVNYGENKTYTFAPNTGYHFVDLFVDDVHQDSTSSYTFINVTGDHMIKAKFGINTYKIAASASTGGLIKPAGSTVVNYGESQAYTFLPESGYHFVDLFVDNIHSDSTTSYTFTNVSTNHTIEARYALNQFTIVATAGAHGTITPEGAVTVDSGSNQSFAITADEGYYIADIHVDT